jgi:hypothetical protein
MNTMQIRRAFASLFLLFQIKTDLPQLVTSQASSTRSLADLKVRACAENSASLLLAPRCSALLYTPLRHRLLTAACGRLIGYVGKSLQLRQHEELANLRCAATTEKEVGGDLPSVLAASTTQEMSVIQMNRVRMARWRTAAVSAVMSGRYAISSETSVFFVSGSVVDALVRTEDEQCKTTFRHKPIIALQQSGSRNTRKTLLQFHIDAIK